MTSARPNRRVRHPILRLTVLRGDGPVEAEQRVFCKFRRESVPVAYCAGCSHCDAIRAEPTATVECTIPARPDRALLDAVGERTEVATLLCAGTLALQETGSLCDAIRVLREGDRRSIAVVDNAHVLVGVVHELAFGRRSPVLERHPAGAPDGTVSSIMSAPMCVHEAMPIRATLRLLAASHLRDVTVVAFDGRPLGLFRDIDGLRWIARARMGASHEAASPMSSSLPE